MLCTSAINTSNTMQTTVLIIKKATLSNSQNVKDSSHGNKCLRKIKINLRTKVEICISTYSNVDIATCRMEYISLTVVCVSFEQFT